MKRYRRLLLIISVSLVLLPIVLLKTGCITVEPGVEPDDPEQVYHHNWWNYYRRGTVRLQEERIEDARSDFEIALGIKSGAKFGYDEDMWRARTYGLHFIEGYFPNRELGVCLYEQGQYEEAVKYLEKSLEQTPSGRAKHYANLAKKKLLAAQRPSAPAIQFDGESAVVWTKERTRRLSGVATGKGLVRKMSVNGQPLFVELAEESLPFDEVVHLSAGRNPLVVEVTDLLGQSAKRELVWVADWQPPELAIAKCEMDGDELVVTGTCFDDFGLVSVSLGGKRVFRAENGQSQKRAAIDIRLRPGAQLLLVAEDLAGNLLEMPIIADTLSPRPVSAVNVAAVSPVGGDGCTVPLAGVRLVAGREDRSGPSLRLRGAKPVMDVFSEEYFLNGTITDESGLSSLTINGDDLLPEESRGVIQSYFARRLPLEVGTNVFTVMARDQKGNETTEIVALIRHVPEYMDVECRLSMGVPPFLYEEDRRLGEQVEDSVQKELAKDPVRFHLMQARRDWEKILREQGLDLADLSDPRAATKIRKSVPTDTVLIGSLMRDGAGLTIYARAVDTARGRILAVEDVYTEAEEEDLAYQITGLIMKIEQGFPLLSGNIVGKTGSKVTIDVGSEDGISPDTVFVVINRGSADQEMEAGKVCKVEGELAELRVDRVRPDTAVGRILPDAGGKSTDDDDCVFTR